MTKRYADGNRWLGFVNHKTKLNACATKLFREVPVYASKTRTPMVTSTVNQDPGVLWRSRCQCYTKCLFAFGYVGWLALNGAIGIRRYVTRTVLEKVFPWSRTRIDAEYEVPILFIISILFKRHSNARSLNLGNTRRWGKFPYIPSTTSIMGRSGAVREKKERCVIWHVVSSSESSISSIVHRCPWVLCWLFSTRPFKMK